MGDVNELRVDREIKEMRLVDEAVQKELTKRRDMQRERDKKRMEVQKLRKMLGMLESFVELRERRQFNDRVDQLWLRKLQTQMNTIQMKINETQSEIDEELRSAARQKRELYYHSPVDYATFAKRRYFYTILSQESIN